MRKLYALFLLWFCSVLANAAGPSQIAVIASTNGNLLTPTNFFISNLVAGANIGLVSGAGGKVSISAVATNVVSTNLDSIIVTNFIRGTNQDFYTTTNVPGGIMTWDWFTNLTDPWFPPIYTENYLVHGDTNDPRFSSSLTLTVDTNMVMWTNSGRLYIASQPGAGSPGVAGVYTTNVLWLSPDGNDASAIVGRMDKPFLTFSNACRALGNNQAIRVLPGVYTNWCATQGSWGGDLAYLYYIGYKTNVEIEGIGWPSLCHTSQISGLVLQNCNGVRLRGLTFQGLRWTNVNDVICRTFGHVEQVASTNVIIEDCRFIEGTDFAIIHPVGGFGNTFDTIGTIVRRCYFWNFGSWIGQSSGCGSQQRFDGGAIASGSWDITDNVIVECNMGIEPYPFISSGPMSPSRIALNQIYNSLTAAIGSSAAWMNQGIISENIMVNELGVTRGGTNPLPTVSALDWNEASGVQIKGNVISGFTNAFKLGANCTNMVFAMNLVTNCVNRFSGITTSVSQDDYIPTDISGFGKLSDGAGLRWGETEFKYQSDPLLSGLSIWTLNPSQSGTNRTGLMLGYPLGGAGSMLVLDDWSGADYDTLSIYSSLADLGALHSVRAANGYFSGTLYATTAVVSAGIYYGDGSGLSNVTATTAGVTNAIASVWINGTNLVASGATNINLIQGANVTIIGTNSPAGQAHISISASAGSGDAGGTNSRQWGTATLTNLSAAGITNWIGSGLVSLTTNNGAITFTGTSDSGGTNSRQNGSAVLTNLTAAGITNWIGAGDVTLTTNSGAITFTGAGASGTNARQWGTATLTNLSASGITNWIGAGTTVLTTNNGAITFTSSGGDPGGTNSRQWGTATLTNLSAAGITNWIGAGTVSLTTNNGAITFTGTGAGTSNFNVASFNFITVSNVATIATQIVDSLVATNLEVGSITNVIGVWATNLYVGGSGGWTNVLDMLTSDSGEANVNGDSSLTNATRIGLVAGKSGVTNLLRSLQGGLNMSLTNQGTNVMLAVSADPVFSASTVTTQKWAQGTLGSDLWQTYIVGSGLAFSNTGGNKIVIDNNGVWQWVGGSNYGWNYLYTGTMVTNAANNLATNVATYTVTNTHTVLGPVYSTSSSASNSPAANEFPSAQWVRGLFNNAGSEYYISTNIDTGTNVGSDQPLYKFQFSLCTNSGARNYATTDFLTNNGYIGSVVTTNTFQSLGGNIAVHSYIGFSGGASAPTVSIKPEIYWSYDKTNWYGDYSGSFEPIIWGQTNLYSWALTYPYQTSTNSAGFYIQRRFKIGSTVGGAGTRVLTIFAGTNLVSGADSASHIAMQSPSATVGNAYLANNQTFTGTNTFAAIVVTNISIINPLNSAFVTNGTSSTLAVWGPDKRATNIANGSGTLTNDGSGNLSWTPINTDPHRVNVKSFGALGTGVGLTNVSILAGMTNLFSTNGQFQFTQADSNKLILIEGAGPGGATNDLLCMITNVQSFSNVLVNASAVRGVVSKNAVYGWDDSTNIQSALNYAVSNKMTLYFPPGIYVVNGYFQNPTTKNSIFTVPNHGEQESSPYSYAVDNAYPIRIEGETLGTTGGGIVWYGWHGSWIACVNTTNSSGNLFQFGDDSVGSWSNTGDTGTSGYNNSVVRIKGIGIRMPNNTRLTAIDCLHNSGNSLEDVNVFAGHNSYSSVIQPLYSSAIGVRMSYTGLNGNGLNTLDRVQIAGFFTGLEAYEHTHMRSITIYSCARGVSIPYSLHLISSDRLGIQSCPIGIIFGPDPAYVQLTGLEIEKSSSGWATRQWDISDPSDVSSGIVMGVSYNSTILKTNANKLKVFDMKLHMTPEWSAPTNGVAENTVLTFANGTNKWAAASGAQTPWTSDINGGGYSLTNVSQIKATNGLFITGQIFPVASMANGDIQLWNSNAVLYAIIKSTGGTVTTNKIVP